MAIKSGRLICTDAYGVNPSVELAAGTVPRPGGKFMTKFTVVGITEALHHELAPLESTRR